MVFKCYFLFSPAIKILERSNLNQGYDTVIYIFSKFSNVPVGNFSLYKGSSYYIEIYDNKF